MDLIVKDHIIDTPMEVILRTLKSELRNGKLSQILDESDGNIGITCPVHKGGAERRPSCYVMCDKDHKDLEYGTTHCFTCGYKASLPALVSNCFGYSDITFGEEWLVERFGVPFSRNLNLLPEIVLDKPKKQEFLDESILNQFNYYHDYMWQRKLTKEVVDTFRIGYDPKYNCITFPVWDEMGRLVMVTNRRVNDKGFYIQKGIEKPLYLLNFIKQWNIKAVIICEAQIDALTAWSYGHPAIATLGGITKKQIDILNRSGIRTFITMFDNDDAGRKFTRILTEGLNPDILVFNTKFPDGCKDINDMTEEQFRTTLENKF